MKLILRVLSLMLLCSISSLLHAQCTTPGYNQAQLNWDKLDYYYNSGSTGAYQTYVTNSMEMTQKFGIGTTYITFQTPAAGIANGENGTHTGNIAGYTGDDAQFTPSSNGQTITLTFNNVVENVSFTLYDVDADQILDIDAFNASNVKQNVSIALQGSTILTRTNGTNALIDASSTSLANTDNRGTATITINSQVKRIEIVVTNRGSDAVFWMSDIFACVNGSFPNNYQQTGSNQPLQGPFTNQPSYFIVTPDNNSAYMVNTSNGEARLLFTDASNTYMNCFAYDPYNRILYYVSEGWPAVSTNKQLKKYDFNTNTISVVIADISTTFNIPTFDQSLEGAGGAFYNGQLYLGVEGGKYNPSGTSSDRTRESMVFRIDFDASLNPVDICQVFAIPSYVDASNTMLHDWGDFILKDGVLINYNSRTSPTTSVKFEHFNLMTGNSIEYNSSSISASQAGMDWQGNLYSFYSDGTNGQSIRHYDGAGGFAGPLIPITLPGGTWPGGAGDAAENFRPAVDFGDAPATYDPNPASPASHDIDPLVRLGSNYDMEYISRGQLPAANSDNHDDALPFAPIFDPNYFQYLTQATVFNNSGANATVCAWLDFDGDGQFEASEGITVNVGSSASPQQIWLYWPMISSSLAHGSYTYLRIRITNTSNGMTTSHSTGYFPTGEVEDYRVAVNSYALSTQAIDFNAKMTNARSVKLDWTIADESNILYYVVERSKENNSVNWEKVSAVTARGENSSMNYESLDPNTLSGISYYRLKMVYHDGSMKLSQVRKIEYKGGELNVTIAPNPARSNVTLYIQSNESYDDVSIEVFNSVGSVIHTEKMKLSTGNNSLILNEDGKLSAGHYIIRLICDKKVITKTLIIAK